MILLIPIIMSFSMCLFSASTDISGVLFSNYNIYTSDYRSDKTPAKNFNTFDIGRIYITASKNHFENFLSKVTIEGNTLSNGNSIFLKLAYLSYITENRKIYIDFGLVPSLWIGWEERAWDNVFVEFIQMHYLKMLNPSDKGLRGGYNILKNFKLEAMISNGEGFKTIENSKTKNLDAMLSYLYGSFGISGFYSFQIGKEEKQTFSAGAYYKSKSFLIGSSFFKTVEFSSTSITSNKNGFSVYSNYYLNDKNVVFARYDYFDRNISKSNDISNYWIFGFKNKPLNGIEIALSYKSLVPQKNKLNIKKEDYVSFNIYVKF